MACPFVPSGGARSWLRSPVMTATLATSDVVVHRSLLGAAFARSLHAMMVLREFRGEVRRDDQVPGACSFWGDSTLDAVLLGLWPDVEAVAGADLLPTYGYGRLYHAGDALARHTDRDAAEVVVSVHLGHRGAAPPPIWLAAPDPLAVHQEPGDAVVFHGTRVPHWREPFTGRDFGQLFLNYVRADGPHRGHALDGRRSQFPALARIG